MDFDLRQLEILCAVVEHRSFSKAAAAVDLAQASVSQRIATLERDVGSKLLDRFGRQVVPTKIGQRLYERAVELLEAKRDIRVELEGLLGVMHGTVFVGASTIPGEFILPGILARFRGHCPDIVVHSSIADTDEILVRTAAGSVEIGVVGSKRKTPNLKYRELWKDELVVAVPAGHSWAKKRSVRPEALREQPFISREPGSGTRAVVEGHLAGVLSGGLDDLRVVAELGSTSAVKEGVKGGLGVSILSLRALETELRAGILSAVKIQGIVMKRSFYLVHDRRRTRSPICRALSDFLIDDATGS
ncbi:MAG: selenium metabolism-associated LysR family transcriptional regulator [Candidatus Binatia bacterium]